MLTENQVDCKLADEVPLPTYLRPEVAFKIGSEISFIFCFINLVKKCIFEALWQPHNLDLRAWGFKGLGDLWGRGRRYKTYKMLLCETYLVVKEHARRPFPYLWSGHPIRNISDLTCPFIIRVIL